MPRNADLTIGFSAHSIVHGPFGLDRDAGFLLCAFARGLVAPASRGHVQLCSPLRVSRVTTVCIGNPDDQLISSRGPFGVSRLLLVGAISRQFQRPTSVRIYPPVWIVVLSLAQAESNISRAARATLIRKNPSTNMKRPSLSCVGARIVTRLFRQCHRLDQ